MAPPAVQGIYYHAASEDFIAVQKEIRVFPFNKLVVSNLFSGGLRYPSVA
jgi:hypothetical protein